mmetsp:Transcript_2952/g.18559  ORF Transcript_2952/g.18559 Transcript_2952/m.18559 type:complete len:89 (+) Transcript_2952:619-885(+)
MTLSNISSCMPWKGVPAVSVPWMNSSNVMTDPASPFSLTCRNRRRRWSAAEILGRKRRPSQSRKTRGFQKQLDVLYTEYASEQILVFL